MTRRLRNRGRIWLCLAPLAAAGCVPHVALETSPELMSTEWSGPASPVAPAPALAVGLPATPLPANLGAALGSTELEALIARAAAANTDVGIAAARVRQARALLGAARGAMLPAVTASAGLSGTRTERSSADPFDFSDAFAGLDIAFDLDLFGAGRAERRAARQRLRAAQFDRDATLLVVQSDVARIYVQRAALAARIALLDRNITQAQELERIIGLRFRAGEATRVDLGLQTIEVRQLQTERLRLAEALDRTRTALAVLTGEEAPLFALAPAPIETLAAPALAAVQPAGLLVRRPDLKAAEARILAAGGDVDRARAAFFPRLTLSARALGQAASLSGPLSSTFALGADLLAPIFARGRLGADLEFAGGRQAESVELYRQVLLTSLAEVEDALSAAERSRAREALVTEVVEEARLTARLARLQYIEGEADLQRVLEAERRLIQAEDSSAIVRQERLEAAIDLFKAMGGSGVPVA
jgi:NodT family efflux transporter outer membrane factor (OMF) lipoprotein